MANRKTLVLEQTPEGCIVPVSHKLNQDGYFRKRIQDKLVMYHRWVWEQENGSIPEGYEIDHKCNNRACCNLDHLQVLDRTTHLVKTNKERYADRLSQAKDYWESTGCSGSELGRVFNVAVSTGCRWVRNWLGQ